MTTAGSWRRSCATALARSSATTVSYWSNAQRICFCSAGSSSTISRGLRFGLLMRLPAAIPDRAAPTSHSGRDTRTLVPTFGVLSTRIRPPSPVTYWKLS